MATAPVPARVHRVLESALPEARAAAKRQLLAESLRCFNARGLEATTIDDLRTASGQSVGTIYHHFKNKEGLVAALLLIAIDDQSRAIAAQTDGLAESHAMVAALVTAYVEWITTQPELANFIFLAREAVAKGPQGDELRKRLAARYEPVDACMARDVQAQRLLDLPEELIPALVLGPAEAYARAWLAGRRLATPASHAALLAEAAWRSVVR